MVGLWNSSARRIAPRGQQDQDRDEGAVRTTPGFSQAGGRFLAGRVGDKSRLCKIVDGSDASFKRPAA